MKEINLKDRVLPEFNKKVLFNVLDMISHSSLTLADQIDILSRVIGCLSSAYNVPPNKFDKLVQFSLDNMIDEYWTYTLYNKLQSKENIENAKIKSKETPKKRCRKLHTKIV